MATRTRRNAARNAPGAGARGVAGTVAAAAVGAPPGTAQPGPLAVTAAGAVGGVTASLPPTAPNAAPVPPPGSAASYASRDRSTERRILVHECELVLLANDPYYARQTILSQLATHVLSFVQSMTAAACADARRSGGPLTLGSFFNVIGPDEEWSRAAEEILSLHREHVADLTRAKEARARAAAQR
eukprot:TRINITY_DN57968_c0_g1_i1.p2 TRINITY_DN57968_c0_g1~~TRINITY_DN57968_c0_g1_i1.p2  ORF type:complete len:186 (-),score=11.25 TRINITY_DN57968_c0_g1_i1:526-1083(-)